MSHGTGTDDTNSNDAAQLAAAILLAMGNAGDGASAADTAPVSGSGISYVSATGNADIDGLLSGYKWSGAITYSFPTSSTAYSANYGSSEPTTGFSALSTTEQQLVQSIMNSVVGFTNLSITYAGTGTADIMLAHSSNANPTAYAYYPGAGSGGDVWFGTSYNYTAPRTGDYSTLTHIHEIGHALGLKHSFEYGGPGNTPVPAAHDDLEYTVMSYHSYIGSPMTGYTNEQYGYPTSYMMDDIAALQTLYGADYTLNSGNTVYTWSPTTGQEFINGVAQVLPGANRVFLTIWDGGGTDTYDLSNYTTGVSIDLNPGSYSILSSTQLAKLGTGHYASGNVYNAYLFGGDARSYIENAIGGSGNDTLIGNAIANNLNGGAGNDTLDGRGGNDTLTGGAGSDTFIVGAHYGNEVITDFNPSSGGDLLVLQGLAGVNSFSDVLSHATQSGANTIITFASDEIITLQNVNKTSLTVQNVQVQQVAPEHITDVSLFDGIPTAMINDSINNATIVSNPPTVVITTTTGLNVTTDLDRLHFNDAIVALDISGTAGFAYRLYQAAFDRTPDTNGLSWNVHLLDTQLNYSQMSAAFAASPELIAAYGNLTNEQFVTQLYSNVLGRAPDAPGFAYWTSVLNSGQNTRSDVLIGFSESTENHNAVDPSIVHGIVLDPHYFM